MKTTKTKDYYNVFIRYLNPNEKQQDLFTQFNKDYTDKKEHNKINSNTDIYNFNILEFDNSEGIYDKCNIVKLKYNKNEYSKEELKKLMKDILKEEIETMSFTNDTLSIRLIGFEKKNR